VENFQKTISKNLKLSGVGLHSGEVSNINLIPSDEDTGIRFIRNNNTSVASWYNAEVSKLCTKLKIKKYYISTIEHLMSALMGLGITNLIIETNSNEIPILDGSAKIFYEEILKAGLKKQKKKTIKIKIKKKIVYSDNNRYISRNRTFR
jgi:UDP-3-O-[3-hydroxymyristoyl] N-acetylglucosamine deacetylase